MKINSMNVTSLPASSLSASRSEDYNQFARDVLEGLSRPQKRLSSMYLYNSAGSRLFDRITELPEYYLTRAEMNIIEQKGKKFFASVADEAFNLFELGCGNGDKTLALLQQLLQIGQHFHFYPIDISQYAIDGLLPRIQQRFPLQRVSGQLGNYQQLLPRLKHLGQHTRNVVLFLGSNIGNYNTGEADDLLQDIHRGLNPGDLLLLGLDLKKDYHTLLAAYNDEQGITRDFNLNLLQRMNDELAANFDLNKFEHYEIYNPLAHAMQSFLVAKETQVIYFARLGHSIRFEAHEALWVESSHKYSFGDIEAMARRNGFTVIEQFTDRDDNFVDSLWRRH